ncbi:ferredoxin, partial [Vannielia litorea]|nr:ferredoxin [Vannielia litorea]
LTACPVNALSASGYDTGACHAYLDTPEGADCLNRGCKVRRACPVSAAFPRVEAQSAFHMDHFHKSGTN